MIDKRIERFGLRLDPDRDFEVVNPEWDERYRDYWTEYYRLTQRNGVSQAYAKIEMRRRLTLIGAMLIHQGDADGMICGTFGAHDMHLLYIDQVIGRRRGVRSYAAMNVLMLPGRTVFIADTYVNDDPTAEEIAEMTLLAAEEIRRFGIVAQGRAAVAFELRLVAASAATKMQAALALITALAPDLEVDGEMHGDAALSEEVRLAPSRIRA